MLILLHNHGTSLFTYLQTIQISLTFLVKHNLLIISPDDSGLLGF